MTQCLDIHTHHLAPQPFGVVCASISDFHQISGQLYSIGIHPWNTIANPSSEKWEMFETLAKLPCVVAIGECGIDKLRGGSLFQQILIMKRQIDISEKLNKPLVIHDVKAHDIIAAYRKKSKTTQNWVIHGFRAKPSVAKMLTDLGIYLSFGEKFNPDSLKSAPKDKILAETDESPLPIKSIISKLSEVRGEDLTEVIAENTARFLNIKTR